MNEFAYFKTFISWKGISVDSVSSWSIACRFESNGGWLLFQRCFSH